MQTKILHALTRVSTLAVAMSMFPAIAAAGLLADAAQRGDIEQVRDLLKNGAEVNATQGDGMSALHWAADRGDVELTRLLTYAGANLEAGTRIGQYTPLHVAAARGNAGVIDVLLAAGSNVDAVTTNSGAMPIHIAAGAGNTDAVRALLAAGADPNIRETAWGQTPLTFAAAANRVEIVRMLLDAGADPAMTSSVIDAAEMERADKAAEKRLEQFLAEFKQREGGGVDWRPTPNQVQAAIEASREIQRRWPDVPDPEDDAKLAAAEAIDAETPVQAESIGVTFNADGEPVSDYEDNEETDGEPKLATYGQLVTSWGGLTPLLHAVRQGHVEATLELLGGGADIDQPSDGDGTTPLLMAAINGQFDLALMLIDAGADPDAASDAGTTALFAVLERQWAPRASYAHPVEHQQQEATHLDVLTAALDAGADPNVRLSRHLWYMEYTFSVLAASGVHYEGATPFWRAAQALDIEAMRLLRTHGADADMPTVKRPARRRRNAEQEKTDEPDPSGLPPVPVGGPYIYPIHAAAGAGYGQYFAGNAHRYVPNNWLPAVRYLVEECGADVNLRDANGYTALHHAASRGDNALIRYLVDQGAAVTVVSRKGQTTADMANGPIQRVSPFPDTIALLVSLGAVNNENCVSC